MEEKEVLYHLHRLSKSSFRSRFHLQYKDIMYIQTKGIDTIKKHAADFISQRLASSYIKNDGKQTPMKGHPVFIGQHATACCCRGCLKKWYGIPEEIELSPSLQQDLVDLIIGWIYQEMKRK